MNEENKVQKVVEIRKAGNGVQSVMKASLAEKKEYSPLVKTVRSACFWTMIMSTVLLAALMVMSIWTGFDDTFGKSFTTIVVVVAASAFVALIAPMLDKTEG